MFRHEITFDRAARWLIIALIVGAVFYTVNYLGNVLLPFFIAWFLAYLIFPIVQGIEKYLRIKVRSLSIILALVLVVTILTTVVMLIVPPLIDQFQKLLSIASKYIQVKANVESIPEALNNVIVSYRSEINEFLHSRDFTEALKTVAPQVVKFVTGTFNAMHSFIASCITLLYMFFILLDYEKLSDSWIRIFPTENRQFLQSLKKDVAVALNNYVRGQGLVALIMGILFCIGFEIIGFPMAIGLGILIGILDLVPYLHTFALIPTAFLAMLKAADTGQNFWIIFAMAVGVFLVVQIIIDFIVTPKVMGKAMGMNPAILLLSLSIWGSLLGFIGLIIALPLTTIIMAYWKRYVTRE